MNPVFKCETCGRVFKQKGNLRAHHVTQHLPRKYLYKCSKCECGPTYKQIKNARAHVRKRHIPMRKKLTPEQKAKINAMIKMIHVVESTPSDTAAAIDKIMIDTVFRDHLESKKIINFDNTVSIIVPIQTPGDGNCLLHSIWLERFGHPDINLDGRKMLHKYLQSISENNVFYKRWRDQQTIWNEEDGFSLNDDEWRREWMLNVSLASTEYQPNSTMLHQLEISHVFALANMIKRPIIVLANMWLYVNNTIFTRNRFVGVYLPFSSPPRACENMPLIIGYHESHFSAMANVCKEKLELPLINNEGNAFPIHFVSSNERQNYEKLLKKYLIVRFVGEKKVICFHFYYMIFFTVNVW